MSNFIHILTIKNNTCVAAAGDDNGGENGGGDGRKATAACTLHPSPYQKKLRTCMDERRMPGRGGGGWSEAGMQES